jgi:predicted DNA binding CopG/RHH family protein
VRFTMRGQNIRIIGAGNWRKWRKFYGKKDDKFEDAPKGKLTVIDDFLPPPSQLVRKEDTVKITSEYTRSSIEFLKKEAKKANVPYQHMLRALVDKYVEQHTS